MTEKGKLEEENQPIEKGPRTHLYKTRGEVNIKGSKNEKSRITMEIDEIK